MAERFPVLWEPVGLMKVPTLSMRVKDLALGRARRPIMPSSRTLVDVVPKRSSAVVAEEEDKEEVGVELVTSGTDVSIDI